MINLAGKGEEPLSRLVLPLSFSAKIPYFTRKTGFDHEGEARRTTELRSER